MIASASSTLWAPVEVLENLGGDQFRVQTLPGGVGGWAQAGKVLILSRALLQDNTFVLPADPWSHDVPALTAPVDGDEYIEILLQRQASWLALRWPSGVPERALPPLLEWFIRAGDEDFVHLPKRTPVPERERRPRTYRSAASLIEQRDKVQAQMDAITGSGPDDPASTNLSPFSRSKAAARAGRRRFEKLDRDLEKYTALSTRLSRLNSQIRSAEAREETQGGGR